MGLRMNLLHQGRFCPAKLTYCPDIPNSLFETLTTLQDGHILCPADGHGRFHDLRGVLIGPIKLAHPAEVSGREALSVRILFAEILSSGDSRALFRSGADKLTEFAVQLHLQQSRFHQRIQSCKHGAVIYRFSNIHRLLLSGVCRRFIKPPKAYH